MFTALQIAAGLAILSEPFLPFTSAKLKEILRFNQNDSEKSPSWKNVAGKEVLLPSGHQIGKAELLFTKIDDAEIKKQLARLHRTKEENKTQQ